MNHILKLNQNKIFEKKTILITGGTGSFGNHITKILLKNFNPKKIIIFSRDEFKQYCMKKKINIYNEKIRYFLGDIRDYNRLLEAFRNVDIIFHAAALKQVDSIEYNPLEAIKTNVYGTENVVRAAIERNVERVIGISTDKSVCPVNLYGATKLCLEKIIIGGNIMGGNTTKFSVLRYGNVMASRGSVIPLFKKQKEKGILTVTHKEMTRFTLTLDEAINFVLNCTDKMIGGEIFVPKLPSYGIVQLARVIAPKAEIKIVGIRPGEKIHESMISPHESYKSLDCGDYYIIMSKLALLEKFQNHPDFHFKCKEGFEYNSNSNPLMEDSKLRNLIDNLS